MNEKMGWVTLSMADTPRIESRLVAILAPSRGRRLRPGRRQAVALLVGTGTMLAAMGALRPIASPQTGVHHDEAFAATETPVQAGQKTPPNFIDSLAPNPRRTQRIADGDVSVEVVGLSVRGDRLSVPAALQRPKTQSQMPKYDFLRTLRDSWKPDGAPLACPLYSKGMWYFDPSDDRNLVEVALRVRSKSGVPVKIVGDSVGCVAGPNVATSVELANFRLPDDIWLEQVDFSRRQKTFPLRLGIAGGAYRWHVDSSASASTAMMAGTPTKVTFSPPLRDALGRTAFVVTNTDLVLPHSILPSCNTHIVALDRQGREVEPTEQNAFTGHGYTQTTVFFNPGVLPPAQIAALRFEARPFHWITFDDVALYPGKARK